MAIGDKYLLTLRGHAVTSGTQIQNAFVYEQIAGSGNVNDLNVAFAAEIVPAIAAVCADEYVMDDVYTVNLINPADFAIGLIDEPGVGAGEYLPIFTTWTFSYLRTTRAINNGRKAIGILNEAAVVNGAPATVVDAAITSLANALGGNIDNPITSSDYSPRLWRRPGTYDSGVVAAPGLFYPVGGVIFAGVSTQNTRKIGRGA